MPEETPQKPATKDAWNEQLAGVIIKTLIGGGFGTFITLFNTSELPKLALGAGIGGAATGAITILSAFVDPIVKRAKEKAGKAGDLTADAISSRTEKVLAKVTGEEEKYLHCQAMDCQTYRPEGVQNYDGIFKPLLEEVFVPLELTTQAIAAGYNPIEQLEVLLKRQSPEEELDIWKLLEHATTQVPLRQMAILAWGGYGKTTLLKHIAYRCAHDRKLTSLVPVLLVLRKYRELLSQPQPPTLPELITAHHVPNLPGGKTLGLPTHWARDLLQQGRAIVMLDGFDEVPQAQRPAVARWLNEQMRQYHKSCFILTSRPKAYQDQEAANRLDLTAQVWVRDFDKDQREKFVRQWYLCQEKYAHGGRETEDVQQEAEQAASELLAQIESRRELQDLAKNPLLLNMIVTFHRRYPSAALPKRRVELYQAICSLQLKDRPSTRNLELLLASNEAQVILQRLALEMMVAQQERIMRDDLLAQLSTHLCAEGETVEAEAFLDEVVKISELLVEREPQEYEFAHLSFQEYLAAAEIARRKLEAELEARFEDDRWKPTILLYSGLVNPGSLMQRMGQRGAIELAYTCWQQTTKRIDPVLVTEIKQRRFAKLEALLHAQQWRQADYETYRLMITTVGKEEKQWFFSKDLQTFPCEELLTIDDLWLKYSKDETGTSKFGFSVQKQIWIECYRPMDYNDDWETFGDRVGWRKDGDWVDYNNLIFGLNAPIGEFPRLVRGWVVGGVGFGGWFFFSRAETCRV